MSLNRGGGAVCLLQADGEDLVLEGGISGEGTPPCSRQWLLNLEKEGEGYQEVIYKQVHTTALEGVQLLPSAPARVNGGPF